MKNKIIVLSMSLCLIVASTAISFADVGQPGKTAATFGSPVETKSIAPRSSGITVTKATIVSGNYLRIVVDNSKNFDITATFEIADAQSHGELINGPFTITVPAYGVYTNDYYIGGHRSGYILFRGAYGSFKWPTR